uniref:CHK kinase-like domain-containing protein n=1 Tax=Panagrolaimus sp. JU765 TaxID=591449 RepID=A0AC34RM50_9BILA
MTPNSENKTCSVGTVDLDKKINGSSVTVRWVVDSLRSHDKIFIEKYGSRKIKDLTWYDASAGKAFISVVLRCTVIFEDSVDENDVYTTIVKIPGRESYVIDNDEDGITINPEDYQDKLARFHNFECAFYNNLAPILEMPVAKTFQAKMWITDEPEGCIHMEDLTLRGKVMNYYDTLNMTQLKVVIKYVTRMQARALALDSDVWSGKYIGNQDAFEQCAVLTKNALRPFKKLANEKCPPAAKLAEKYSKFLTNREFIKYAFSQSYKDLHLTPVCVHGDLWACNIMIAIDKNGDFTNEIAAFVDWQIFHEGGPMDDFSRLLTLCADGNVRREVESFLIDFYLENLTKELEGTAAHALYLSILVKGTLPEDPKFQRLNNARIDKGLLRALHALEDLDRLLSGKYKFLMEKYGK